VATETRKPVAGAKRTGMVIPLVAFRVVVSVNMLFDVGVGPPAKPAAPVLSGGGVGAERGIVLGLATPSEIGPIIPTRDQDAFAAGDGVERRASESPARGALKDLEWLRVLVTPRLFGGSPAGRGLFSGGRVSSGMFFILIVLHMMPQMRYLSTMHLQQ
jgi:hypothetical protein